MLAHPLMMRFCPRGLPKTGHDVEIVDGHGDVIETLQVKSLHGQTFAVASGNTPLRAYRWPLPQRPQRRRHRQDTGTR